MSDYSIYPKAIDGYAQIPLAVDKRSPINAESVNRLRSGIINIEKAIGIAPEFSEEFGSFPDFASRVDNLEGQLAADTSLTGLYQRDNILQLDEEPLILSTPDGSHLGFGSSDENFIIASSTGLELEAKGVIPGPINPEYPPIWPRSVVINKSEMVPLFLDGSPEPGHVSSYLSLGGEVSKSDLAILKLDPPDSFSNEGGQIAIIAGLNSALDDSVGPVSLSLECFETLMPGPGGADINIRAGSSLYESDGAGGVRIASGRHPLKDGSSVDIEGPDGHDYGGRVTLNAGGLSSGDASGGRVDCNGSEGLSGGDIGITGGHGQDEGGHLDLRAGNAEQGGGISISAGHSNSNNPANVSNIWLQPGGNNNGVSGSVYINGNTDLQQDLSVNGHTNLQDTTVNGNTSLQQDLSVNGNTSLQQDLSVNGHTSLQHIVAQGNTDLLQNLDVNGNTSLQQDLSVNGNTSLQGVNVNQDLTVGGDTELGGLTVNAATEMQGSLVVGDTTILEGMTHLEGVTQINNLQGTPPVKDNVLVADDIGGTVKWASPSQYVSGVAFNPGTYGGGNIRQVIFTDPTSGVTSNGGCWIAPMDITIEKIFIKWVGEGAPDITVGRDLTWSIGALTSNTGTANTTGGTNFTDSGENLDDLQVDSSDHQTFFYKTASLNYDVSEGDILVLKHALAVGAWSEASMDVTVTVKYHQRWS